MSTVYNDVEFRAALLQTCGTGMNSETWNGFCFLFGTPEGVREKSRPEVLEHLLTKKKISREKPQELSRYLSQSLGRNDLADKFLVLLQGDVEARENCEQTRQRDDSRRHGMHLRSSQIPDFSIAEDDEEEETEEERGKTEQEENDIQPVMRDRASAFGNGRRQRRHDSTVSSRSSGYFSVSSRTSMMSSLDAEEELQTVPTVPEATDETDKKDEAMYREDSIPRSSSHQSFSSSSAEEECHSGLSSSHTSLSTIDSLPRNYSTLDTLRHNFSTDGIYNMELPTALTPTPDRQKRESSPEEVIVQSPTHTTIKKMDTMILKCHDIISDIDSRLKHKVYQSISSPGHGIDFKTKFYPVDHEGTCSAVFIKVMSHLRKKVIPPLDVSVTIIETNDGTARDISSDEGGAKVIVQDQRTSKGNFVIQGQFTALFNKIVDHNLLRKVSSKFLAIQVTMEYSNHHQ